jgi:hypothetical protein
MTQAALARELAVTTTTVARWERGEQVIGRPGAVLLALNQLGKLHDDRTLDQSSFSGQRHQSHPVDVSSFVGREREVYEITDLLTCERLVTICGTGGVGRRG